VDGLRALAALMVFLNHAYAQSFNPILDQYPTGLLSIFSYSLVTGHLAVSVFIVISGFCLSLPVMRSGDRPSGGVYAFLKRRARRILPPYYAALALSLLLIATVIGKPTGSLWDVPIAIDEVAIISHLVLLQDLFGTGRINYVFWSIAVEWHIYFLFPLLLLATRRFGIVATAFTALVLGYALTFGFAGTRLARANPHYLGLFALGMLAAYVAASARPAYASARTSRGWSAAIVISLLVTAAACYAFGYRTASQRFPYLDLPVGVLAAATLVVTTRSRSHLLTRLLSGRALVFIGTFSYSVYLVHAPLLQLMWQYVLVPLGLTNTQIFAALTTLGTLAVLAFSYGFFRLFELPFLRRKGHGVAEDARPVVPAALV
jgi:peptidoglycan/LPS O-acetylase OafA/YrhL